MHDLDYGQRSREILRRFYNLPYGGARYLHKYPRNRHTWDAMKRAYALWTRERITALIAAPG